MPRALQVVQDDPEAQISLAGTTLGSFERSRDAVEQIRHDLRVRVRIIDRVREQRARDRPRIRVDLVSEATQLGGVLVIKDDIHAIGGTRHATTVHASAQIVQLPDAGVPDVDRAWARPLPLLARAHPRYSLISNRCPSGSRKKQRVSGPCTTGGVRKTAPRPRSSS